MKMKKILCSLPFLLLWTAVSAPHAAALAPGDPLIPGGEVIGIEIVCDGVLVSGFADVETDAGAVCPAKTAGLCAGDRIVAFNGRSIHTGEDFLAAAAELTGENVELTAVRADTTLRFHIRPERSTRGVWQLGLWLRSGIRGIGTVTFRDPENGLYGALGHAVSLSEDGTPTAFASGTIRRAEVSGVVPGKRGEPGELLGGAETDVPIGSVETNCESGIFGFTEMPDSADETLPAADAGEMHLGKASILSTVDERGPQEFSVDIIRISRSEGESRQIMLNVTDPELLAVTGGIVQGMSGSPILQDGRIVGAVTHVLVSDPTKGYGISIGNMLERAVYLSAA